MIAVCGCVSFILAICKVCKKYSIAKHGGIMVLLRGDAHRRLVDLEMSYSIMNLFRNACLFCTIRHVLLECADLILLRQQYFRTTSLSDLFLNVDAQTILAFLKDNGKARLL